VQQAVRQRRQRCLTAAQKRNRRFLQDRLERLGETVHPLPQRPFRGYLIEPQDRGKVRILSEPVDGLEVTLAQIQQGNVARQNITMTNSTAAHRRDRVGIGCQVGALVKRHANEAKTGMGGEICLGFANDES